MSKTRSEKRRENNRQHLESLARRLDPKHQQKVGRILATTRIEMARQVVDLESPIGAFQVAKETLSRLRTNIPTVVTVEGARLEADLNTTAVEMIARAGASNLYRPKKRT